jgi:hypothetical protein
MKELSPKQLLALFLNGNRQERQKLYNTYSIMIGYVLKKLIVSIIAEFDLLPKYRKLGNSYIALKLENGNLREYEIDSFINIEKTYNYYKNNIDELIKVVNEFDFDEIDIKQLTKLLNNKQIGVK